MAWRLENCSEGWAHDSLFPTKERGGCELNLAFFCTFVAVLLVVQIAMFVVRTEFMLRRAKQLQRPLVPQQYITLAIAVPPMLFLLLMLVLPNALPSSTSEVNVMYLLFGLHITTTALSMIRWVWKLRRLGYRLILKRLPDTKAAIRLASGAGKTERLTVVLTMLAYLVAIMFLLCACVGVAPSSYDYVLVRATFGLLAAIVLLAGLSAVIQSEQCIAVITASASKVDDLVDATVRQRYDVVIKKFKFQRGVLAGFSLIAIVPCTLAAAAVIPAEKEMYLLLLTMDVVSCFAMLGSLTCRCNRHDNTGSDGAEEDGIKSSRILLASPVAASSFKS
ncbi:hypothetical protein BASA81_007386 [Batrachochytrium salamandrivorans]|nr:hypothetical protein BASA81_007386 [Batrachochytrium salamandrivorans]